MSSRVIIPILAAAAMLVLWRLASKTPPAISFDKQGMVLRNGTCQTLIPVKRLERQDTQADVVSISRHFATLYDGEVVVDEKITLPANNYFDKAVEAVVAEVFDLKNQKTTAQNGKMALFEGERDGEPFAVLAIFKGKSDLELLYPLPNGLKGQVVDCLIEKKRAKEATVVNRVVEEGGASSTRPKLSHWDDKLFSLGYIVNKDM
ncbi:MAG: hypothetical protein GXO33_01390 [Epsilonproteobacteria bacterium]|nr:hypothetical protein [Campylobacterota bacterium]